MTGKMTALVFVLLTALSAGAASADEVDPMQQFREVPEGSTYGIRKVCIEDQWYLVTDDEGIPSGITPKLKGGRPELCVEPTVTKLKG
jgi:hypothetical protein